MRAKSLTLFMNSVLVNPEIAALDVATRHLQVFIAGSPDEFSLVKSPATNVHANAGGNSTEETQSPVKKKSYFSFRYKCLHVAHYQAQYTALTTTHIARH